MVKGLEPIPIPHPREADEPNSWPASPNYCSASWWSPGPLASPHMITNPTPARIKDIMLLNQNVQRRPKHSSLTCGQSESSFLLQRVECVLGQVVWSVGVSPYLGNSCLRTRKTLPWHMHAHMCSNGDIGSILSRLGTILASSHSSGSYPCGPSWTHVWCRDEGWSPMRHILLLSS